MTAKPYAAAAAVMLVVAGAAFAGDNDWPTYGRDAGGSRFSPLTQITRENVTQLKQAWSFRTGELGKGWARGDRLTFEATPILWDGKLYFTTAFSKVFAIDAVTGEKVWDYDPELPRDARYAEVASRGVSIWYDAAPEPGIPCASRIFLGTLDARLIALDARSGKPCADFGEAGQVDLTKDVRLTESGISIEYTVTSPPAIVGDKVITGSAIGDNRGVELELGIVRAFDARSGEMLWLWDPIPRTPDNPYFEEWSEAAARKTGAANAWTVLAADIEHNLVYVPTGSASPDFYGGERTGNNTYANSIVALDADTGKVVWHYQLVHHDVWDYDLASQPVLFTFRRGNEEIPALAQATKMGMVFVFNRLTGEPLIPIEERPVPQGGVPGEALSPTQPFSALPPMVDHGPITLDDAWAVLPWHKTACAKEIARYRSEGIYTPPSLEGTIVWPGYAGGSNWGSVAVDEKRQLIIGNVIQLPMVVTLYPREEAERLHRQGLHDFSEQEGTPYIMARHAFLGGFDTPCVRPPWGKLVALDLQTRTKAWDIPFGTVEDVSPFWFPNVEYGMPSIGGPIITGSGLVFIGAASDDYLRAYDVETGEELWKGRLPAGGQATPMTYEAGGRQYVVIAAGGHAGAGTTRGDYVVAYALLGRR